VATYPDALAQCIAREVRRGGTLGVRVSPCDLEPNEAGALIDFLREELGAKVYISVAVPGVEEVRFDDRTCLCDGERAAQLATAWRNVVKAAAGEAVVYVSVCRQGRAGGLRDTLRPLTDRDLVEHMLQVDRLMPAGLGTTLRSGGLAAHVEPRQVAAFSRAASGEWRRAGDFFPLLGLVRDSLVPGGPNDAARMSANLRLVRAVAAGEVGKVRLNKKVKVFAVELARRLSELGSLTEEVLGGIDLGELADDDLATRPRPKPRAKPKPKPKPVTKPRSNQDPGSRGSARPSAVPKPEVGEQPKPHVGRDQEHTAGLASSAVERPPGGRKAYLVPAPGRRPVDSAPPGDSGEARPGAALTWSAASPATLQTDQPLGHSAPHDPGVNERNHGVAAPLPVMARDLEASVPADPAGSGPGAGSPRHPPGERPTALRLADPVPLPEGLHTLLDELHSSGPWGLRWLVSSGAEREFLERRVPRFLGEPVPVVCADEGEHTAAMERSSAWRAARAALLERLSTVSGWCPRFLADPCRALQNNLLLASIRALQTAAVTALDGLAPDSPLGQVLWSIDTVSIADDDGTGVLVLGPLHPLSLERTCWRLARHRTICGDARLWRRWVDADLPDAPAAWLVVGEVLRLGPALAGLATYERCPSVVGGGSVAGALTTVSREYVRLHPQTQVGLRVEVDEEAGEAGVAAVVQLLEGEPDLSVELHSPRSRTDPTIEDLIDRGRLRLVPTGATTGEPRPHLEVRTARTRLSACGLASCDTVVPAGRYVGCPSGELEVSLQLRDRPLLRVASAAGSCERLQVRLAPDAPGANARVQGTAWQVAVGGLLPPQGAGEGLLVCSDHVASVEVRASCRRPEALGRRVGSLLRSVGVELSEVAVATLAEALMSTSGLGLVGLGMSPEDSLARALLATHLAEGYDVAAVASLGPLLEVLGVPRASGGALLVCAGLRRGSLLLRAGWGSLDRFELGAGGALPVAAESALSAAMALLSATRNDGTRGEVAMQVVCRVLAPRV